MIAQEKHFCVHGDFSVFVLIHEPFVIFSAPCFAEKGNNCGLVGHLADSQCKSTLSFTYQGIPSCSIPALE